MLVFSHPQDVPGKTDICCEQCGCIVATVSDQELLMLESGKYGPVLCFDCDGQVDDIPELLAGPYPYLLGLKKPVEGDKMNYWIIDPWKCLKGQQGQLEWLQGEVTEYFRQVSGEK